MFSLGFPAMVLSKPAAAAAMGVIKKAKMFYSRYEDGPKHGPTKGQSKGKGKNQDHKNDKEHPDSCTTSSKVQSGPGSMTYKVGEQTIPFPTTLEDALEEYKDYLGWNGKWEIECDTFEDFIEDYPEPVKEHLKKKLTEEGLPTEGGWPMS